MWPENEMAKRIFDIGLSIFGLVAFSPILVVCAISVKLEDRGPVFYRGIRVGRYGELFRLYKFRTMVVDAEIVECDPIIDALAGFAIRTRYAQSSADMRALITEELTRQIAQEG